MKNFKLQEFQNSDTARRKNIDNSIPQEYLSHINDLVNNILDPLADAWGHPIAISSGFRCDALNKAIGGSITSAHSFAYAADMVSCDGKTEEFKEFTMKWLYNNHIKFDQYINEYSGNSSWVHIGFKNRAGAQRQQYMLYKGGKYTSIDPKTFSSSNADKNNTQNSENSAPVSSILYENDDDNNEWISTTNNVGFGKLTGSSIYLKDIDLGGIASNNVYKTTETGEPIIDETTGKIQLSDEYLAIEDDTVPNEIADIYEIPKEPVDNNENNSGTSNSSVDDTSNDADTSNISSKKGVDKKKAREQSIKNWENKSLDNFSKGEIYSQLIDWLQNQSIMLQNAFHILIIKDMIDNIKETCDRLQNSSFDHIADMVNNIQDIFTLFEMLGFTPDAKGITLDDLRSLGMATIGTAVKLGKDVSDQMYANVQQLNATQQTMLGSKAQELSIEASNTLQNAQNIGQQTIDSAGQITGSIQSNYETYKNSLGNTIQDATGNLTSGQIPQLPNVDGLTGGQITTYDGKKYDVSQQVDNNDTKNIFINLTCYVSPIKFGKELNDIIDSFEYEGKSIFNAGSKLKIKNSISDAWDDNKSTSFEIRSKVGKISKLYTWNISINRTSYDEWSKNNQDDNSLGVSNQLSDISNNAQDMVMSQYSDIKNNVQGQIGDVKNQANNVINDLKNTGSDAYAKLTNVNVGIDPTAIAAVLDGKVLMFDQVIQFLKILQPIIKILQIVCHLLQNYRINKEFVNNRCNANLFKSLKDAAGLVKGLLDSLNCPANTNLFFVRSKTMVDWCMKTFNISKNDISSGKHIIDIAGTIKLNTYVSVHGIKPDYPILIDRKSTLVFIAQEGEDGTLNGIDNIDVNMSLDPSTNTEIYYDKQNRSTITSQILRAQKQNVNPNYAAGVGGGESEEIVNEQIKAPKSFLDAITIQSDEFDGTQAISMDDLSLCDPVQNDDISDDNTNDLSDINSNTAPPVIIEFGDKYTKGEAVQYVLNKNLRPGQEINGDTIFGKIVQYVKVPKPGSIGSKLVKKELPIKSCFDYGVIRSINDNDFYHVYPSTCNRHIVIDNAQVGLPVDVSIGEITSLGKRMGVSTSHYAFIMNNMPKSLLPIYLKNADRSNEISTSNIASEFSEHMKEYVQMVSRYGWAIASMSADPTIANIIQNDPLSVEKIGKNMLLLREHMMFKDVNINDITNGVNKDNGDFNKTILGKINIDEDIYSYFTNSFNKELSIKGSYEYTDCIGLAYKNDDNDAAYRLSDDKFEIMIYNTKKTENIETKQISLGYDFGDQIYRNYYMQLLQNIDLSAEEVYDSEYYIDGKSYALEYYELIKGIIDKRLAIEETLGQERLIDEFNTLYKSYINGVNPYNEVYEIYKTINTNDKKTTYNTIYNFIFRKLIDTKLGDDRSNILNKQEKDDAIKKIETAVSQRNALGLYSSAEDIEEAEKQVSNAYSSALDKFREKDDDYTVKTYEGVAHQLTNMFICITSYNPQPTDKVYKQMKRFGVSLEEQQLSKEYALEQLFRYEVFDGTWDGTIKYNNNIYSSAKSYMDQLYIDTKNYVENLPNAENIDIPATIKEIMINDVNSLHSNLSEKNKLNIYDLYFYVRDNQSISNNALNTIINRQVNKQFFNLVCEEADKIQAFWEKMFSAQRNSSSKTDLNVGYFNFNRVKQDIYDYANKANEYAKWPAPVDISIDRKMYRLYTFANYDEEPEQPENVVLGSVDDMENVEPPEVSLDYGMTHDIKQPKIGDITILDYPYWLVYMANATLFTLIPLFWADGFDIPPFMVPLPLPGIYFPIAPPVMIPIVNVLIVFGIAIRGIWPAPIILMVNLSSQDINVMLPVKIVMELAKSFFQMGMKALENTIPNMVSGLMNGFNNESDECKKKLDKFRTYASVIKSIPQRDKALIEEEFMSIMYDEANNITGKKRDKRQIITREENLGQGQEPF